MSALTPIISLRHAAPCREAFRMASPVDLDIFEGEQIAIVGPNTSGKSRLVDIITGRWPLLPTSSAQYHFPDSPHKLTSDNIKQMSFRDSYGNADTTYYLQQRWNQFDIDEETPQVDGQYIISLSSGELRKFQLYKLLATAPRLLILDNPYIGLDTQARAELTATLEQLIQQSHLQVILVVSREKDIPSFVNRVLYVNDLQLFTNHHAPRVRQEMSKPIFPAVPAPMASEASSEPLIALSHITIRYGRRTILKDFSWSVRQGEHWSLSGANGSGKSTLLSLICADNPQAYACDIKLFGKKRGSGESIWDIKRHIGYVSPEMHRAYLKNYPAIEVVASGTHDSVGLYRHPTAQQRAMCLAWMKLFGIEDLANRPYLQLSSGEQRMCLLARAFVKAPDLLILDEPFHGLDDERRLLATHIIDAYCQQPAVTLIVVSHYEDELPTCITHHLHLVKAND